MPKAAFSAWGDRIAPVFDVAGQPHVVETSAGRIVRETREFLGGLPPLQRVTRLLELGIDALICGAISRHLHGLIAANGIQVISFVTGDLRELIEAWSRGELDGNAFAMPGCRGLIRRHGGWMRSLFEEDRIMNRGIGMGQGGGRGRGAGGGRRGRMGGARRAGPGGNCVCPSCGEKVPHERGIPCFERKCPKCGTAMVRE